MENSPNTGNNPSGVFPLTASVNELEQLARKLRRDIITMIYQANSGHPGGSLSAVEIGVTLYFNRMRHNPSNPKWADRDRFILSKGHAVPMLYAIFAECGYLKEEQLCTLRQMDSCLQGHADSHLTPGVDMSAGALGQGLSFAVGTALAARLDKKDYRTYVLMGDGECDEGQIWEAAMAGAHFKLDNITAIVDNNGVQLDGFNKDIMGIEPFADKWRAFNWNVIEADGHSITTLIDAFAKAAAFKGKPSVIIAHTVKGKGVSFMENKADWHGKAPNADQMNQAMKELA